MTTQYRPKERGSALLIVFVFAAILAISLYMEMPVAAFEAQRQKEHLLISRGHEYAHAVKLFVRKTGHYPSSLKDLEDTNRMRFLRHQYKDPFTGKDDWRLLHAGPNGAIIDSKVKGGMILPGMSPGLANQTSTTPTGTAAFGGGSNNSSFGSNSGGSSFASTSNGSAFGNDSFAKPQGTAGNEDTTPPDVMVQQPRQRPPAISADGEPGAASSADAALAIPPIPGVNNPASGSQGNIPVPNATQAGTPNVPGTPQAANDNSGVANAPPNLKAQMLAAQGSSGFGGQSSGFGSSQSQLGVVQSGGIAGVASKAGGHSIKLINDQDDYAKWEFYYDPTKDRVPGGVQMGAFNQQQNAQQQNGFGTQNGPGQNQSGFGAQTTTGGQNQSGFGGQSSFGQSSGFGQGSSGQGSFGQSSFGQSTFGQNSNGSANGTTAPAPTNSSGSSPTGSPSNNNTQNPQ